jgi:hypothetical protein
MFIRRFLLHAMPDGFHRIRHYGFLANRRRVEKLLLCCSLLAVAVPVDRGEERRQSAISRTIFVLAAAGGWNPSARYCDRSRHALRHGTTAHDRSPMIICITVAGREGDSGDGLSRRDRFRCSPSPADIA